MVVIVVQRRAVSALCLLCLLLSMLAPSRAAGIVYFTGVNDSLLPLSGSTVPYSVSGALHVPYTVFSSTSTGIDLGTYSNYNRATGIVTVYDLRRMLEFDLNAGTSRDPQTGQAYSSKAVLRNGIPFLSLSTITSFFGVQYTLKPTDYGMLLRITNSDAKLSDASFIDGAGPMMKDRLREYQQSLAPSVPATPTPLPPVSEEPTVPDDSEAPRTTPVYLAFLVRDGGGTEQILTTLEGQGLRGLFLFSPDELALQGNLVRRLVGRGHQVGLTAWGENLDSTRSLLAQGRAALAAIATVNTTIALCPESQRAALEAEGWVCWQETANASAPSDQDVERYARNVVSRLRVGTTPVYLTLDDRAAMGAGLSALLRQLSAKQLVPGLPVETVL